MDADHAKELFVFKECLRMANEKKLIIGIDTESAVENRLSVAYYEIDNPLPRWACFFGSVVQVYEFLEQPGIPGKLYA